MTRLLLLFFVLLLLAALLTNAPPDGWTHGTGESAPTVLIEASLMTATKVRE